MTENNKKERKQKRIEKTAKLHEKVNSVPLLRRLFHNTWLKVVSLAFAIVLWVVVMSQDNPPRTKIVYDVPVEITGMETLIGRELSLATDEEELPDTVDVRLEVPMDDLSRVNKDNVRATLDLSGIYAVGEHEVRLSVYSPYGSVLSSTTSRVDVMVESLTTSIVPVRVEHQGNVNSSYRMGQIEVTPAQFQITGPETDINRIVSAVAKIDLSGLKSDFNRSIVYDLVDENDNVIKSVNIKADIGNSVSVSVPVYPMKELPITFENSVSGTVKEGFLLEGIEVSPSTVRIAAPQAVLDELTEVQVSAIDIENATKPFSVTLPLKKNSEIAWMEISEADVSVRVKEETATKTFRNLTVRPRNLGNDYTVEMYGATVDVTVTMAKSELERLFGEDIWVYVDLTGMSEMPDSTTPVHVLIETSALVEEYKVSSEKVVIRIDKKK